MEYNLLAKSIDLDGGREVCLQQGPNEIHARSVYYQATDDGRLGQAISQGPGWLRGQMPGHSDQQLEVTWNDQLRIFPHEHSQVISLSGGATLKSPGIGGLQAREIFFWLAETPTGTEKGQLAILAAGSLAGPQRRSHRVAATDRHGGAVRGVVPGSGFRVRGSGFWSAGIAEKV